MIKIVPKFYSRRVEELLVFSGSRRTVSSFLKQAAVFSLVLSVALALLSGQFLLLWPLLFLGFFGLFHGFLILAVDRRTKFVESILPDALQLVAANIRAGFIPSRALILSARKEFGPLSDGIKTAGKEMVTGKSLQESLEYVTKKIRSEVLDTTVRLISRGVQAGGQLVSLFEETAIDIRRKEAIRKEVRANIVIYGIFISFAAAAGAPALYALSGFLVETIAKFSALADLPDEFSAKLPLLKFGINISSDFLFLFTVLAILVTTVFGGIILGIINSGRERAGIKYIPIFLTVAFVVYFVAGAVIRGIFGGFVPQ